MNTKRYFLSVLTFSALLLTLFVLTAFTRVTRSQSPTSPTVAVQNETLVEAIRRGGYREAAKLKGHYVGTADPNWDWAAFDLETLTKNSAAVIVGVPRSSLAKLSAAGDQITTNYKVRIERVLKGSLSENNLIEVSLIGGRVSFEDGTSAEIQTPNFEQMRNGQRYVFFLYANKNGSDVFILTGGPQGLFELSQGDKVISHARPTDNIAKEVQNKNADVLFHEIRIYAERWSKAQGCCN